jgi:hypothetical protein
MYTPIENRLGIQPIAIANAPIGASVNLQIGQSPFFGKEMPLGTIVRAFDPVFGEGEFIYLQLPTTGNIGQLVTWAGFGVVAGDATVNEAQFQATLTTGTALQGRAIGVLMAAYPPTPTNLSGAPVNAFGWVQIKGAAVALSNGVAVAGNPPYLNTTGGGLITTTVTASKEIWNCQIIAAVGTALPVISGGVQTNIAPFSVTAAAVVSGGTNTYQVGDVLTVLGGTGVQTPAQLTVATLSSGAVATVTVAFNGYYGITAPSGTVSTSGGHGTGATFTLTTVQNYCLAQIDRMFIPGSAA